MGNLAVHECATLDETSAREKNMAKQRVKFTFPQELITLPIIYELGKQFNIVTNVRRADVTEDRGWVVLEMDGPIEEIERGLEWVAAKGVRVDPVQGDIVEG